MRRTLMIIAAAGMILASCGGKKEKAAEEPAFELKSCPVAAIEVSPQWVDDPGAVIRSDYRVLFEAVAKDASGGVVPAVLIWSLRYPDSDSELSSGAGHRLVVLDNNHAEFRASGLAPGVFSVVVQDQSCQLADGERPQYPEGEAWIRVHPDPVSSVVCGRMRVTYGDRIDRMGDEVIASSKVTLLAELSARQKLSRKYRVQFYLNEKPFPTRRPVYKDPTVSVARGMTVGHIALLPIYLVPGKYAVRYELLEGGQPICGSRVERFDAR